MIRDPLDWTPPPRPTNAPIQGRYVDIAPWSAKRHGPSLWESFGGKQTNEFLFHFGWPDMNRWEDLAAVIDRFNETGEFITCIFADTQTGDAMGMASYMAIVPEHGRVEVGAVGHGLAMRRNQAATEAHYLLARRVFDELGYRRYEWKLNNPNQPSHRAAQRYGFTFEGVFRQHEVRRYGSRDTAWYSMLDTEWPTAKTVFEAWLDSSNFDEHGNQIMRLETIRETRT